MKESSTYQAILQEGRDEGEAKGEARGERNFLLRVGAKRFGDPDDQTLSTINALSSLEQLDQLSDRLLEVESWAELLG